MSSQNNKNSIIKKIFAIIGLLIIFILIIILIFALINSNGMLAFASIISLILISSVYWLGLLAYKRLTDLKKNNDNQDKDRIIELSNYNTKNL